MDYFGSGVITGFAKQLTLICILTIIPFIDMLPLVRNAGKPRETVVGVVLTVAS